MRWTVPLAPKLQCTSGRSHQGHPCTVLLTPQMQCKLGRSHEGLPCLIKAILLSQPLGPGQADHLPQVRLPLQDRPRSLPVFLLHGQLSYRLHRHKGAGKG